MIINILQGDTMEHAKIGDIVINWYGEERHIIGETYRCWIVADHRGNTKLVFKHDAHRIVTSA